MNINLPWGLGDESKASLVELAATEQLLLCAGF